MDNKEIWKDVPGYNGEYRVSNLGRVVSYKNKSKGKDLSVTVTRLGFPAVTLFDKKSNKIKIYYVARLVLESFVGFPADPWLCVANCKDGDLENCKLENLEWIVCETTKEYNPEKSHRRGVKRPDITRNRMRVAKLNQSEESLTQAARKRHETAMKKNIGKEIENMEEKIKEVEVKVKEQKSWLQRLREGR